MVPFHTKSLEIAGKEVVAEATLNNCSSLWTAVVKSGETLIASGAGSSPEDAMAAAIQRAESALVASPA